jgi:hypothetical protein
MIYQDFRPTAFDPAGICLPDRQHWIVAPAGRTRDSGCLDESNFETALRLLGGESQTVEIHRFGHWGPGWYELILVDPTGPAAEIVEAIAHSLETYPVLDDEDYSARRWESACNHWHAMSRDERRSYLNTAGMDRKLANRSYYPSTLDTTGALFELIAAD